MSTTLVVAFPLGRYHATPWGRHVNEGQVELPPSPWRLLRALYAVWRTRVPDLDEDTVHSLLEKLAEPPTYFVPPYSLSHTRHWYPDSTRRSGSSVGTDRTLDAFASLGRGAELAVRWSSVLDGELERTLARLAESLPYLGRADSVCTARVDSAWQASERHSVCGPVDVGEPVSVRDPAVTLLTPTLPLDVEALTLRPVDVRAGRLLFPRSTRFVGYWAAGPDRSEPPPRRRMEASRVEAVRFEVVSLVRPPAGEGLHLTDRLRNAAVKRLCDRRGQVLGLSLLAGRAADEERLTGHRHAHYLALPDTQRRVGELVVWAPGGLSADEVDALGQVTRLYGPSDAPGPATVEVRITGLGTSKSVLADFAGHARNWTSITPFTPPRHQKGGWEDFLRSEVQRELSYRTLPVAAVEILEDEDWVSYVRYRPSKRLTGGRSATRSAPQAAFVQLTFDKAQPGPIALGHLAHFGLGLFRPAGAGA